MANVMTFVAMLAITAVTILIGLTAVFWCVIVVAMLPKVWRGAKEL